MLSPPRADGGVALRVDGAAALAVSGVRAALGVLGGGVLVGVSFLALASGTGALAAVVSGQAGADRARLVRAATYQVWWAATLYSVFWRTL